MSSIDDVTIGETTFDFGDDKSEDDVSFYPNRVFINHLDSYHGKIFARIISDKTFRDQEAGGEGGEEQQDEEAPPSLGPDVMTYNYKQTYQVVGTAKNKTYQPTEDVTLVLNEDDPENFIKEIMKCGYIIYDITNDPDEIPKATQTLKTIQKKLEEVKEEGPKKFAKSSEKRVFVLISSVMTWAKTRPVDPEDPEVPFIETDFRKRKPHPNYKPHIDLEKEVIAQGKKDKEHLMTVVIATGSTYGEEEEDLHFLFKLAWQNEIDLPIMQPGNNTVPLINVKDLISILYAVMERVPKRPKYIVAVEQTSCTQKQIVKVLSKVLGNERFKVVTKEESFLYPDMTRTNIEYANAQRQSKAAEAEKGDEEGGEDEEEEDEDWEGKIAEYTDSLKGIERGLEESGNGKLPDPIIIQMLKDRLNSNQCQNQGYVLDGYPKTIEQTRDLFDISEGDDMEEEAGEEEDEGDDEEPKKSIFPHYVIALEASDEFLCERVMQMPESDVQNTHYTEEQMIRRLTEFRGYNTDENTMLNVFDEREVHPFTINAETDNQDAIFTLIQAKIGSKFGYPFSEWELEQKRLKEEDERNKLLEAQRLAREEQERIVQEEHEQNMERWVELLQQLQHEEQQQLTAQCKPLREYLVRFVFPTLTRALLETARVKPEDPVDFLAEYLFKENPEGRMFDPAYVAAADDLFKTIEAFQQRLGN